MRLRRGARARFCERRCAFVASLRGWCVCVCSPGCNFDAEFVARAEIITR